MNLQEEWNSYNDQLIEGKGDFVVDQQTIKLESKGAYETLVKHLKYKFMYTAVFTLVALIVAFLNSGALQNLLFAFAAAFLLAGVMMIVFLKKLPATLDYSMITKSLLAFQLQRIRSVLELERYWGMIFIPLSTLGGLLIGQLLLNNNFTEAFAQINWYKKAPVLLAVALGGIYLAEKMNGIAFKPYLDKLQQHLQELDNNK